MRRFQFSVRSKIATSNVLVLAALWLVTFIGLRVLVHHLMDVAINEELRGMANSVTAKPARKILARPANGQEDENYPSLIEEYDVVVGEVKPTTPNEVWGLTVVPTGKHKLKPASPTEAPFLTKRSGRPGKDVVMLDLNAAQRTPRAEEPYKVFETALKVDGDQIGIVRATYPLDELNRLQKSVDTAMMVLFPTGLLLVAVYGWWSTGLALRPVRQITAAADKMSVDNLSHRFPIGSNDEFSALARSFNHLFDRLHRSFESQGQFVSDASHELRTPLTVVKGNLEWVAKTLPAQTEVGGAIDDALKATARMQSLIDDLLFLAKTDSTTFAVDEYSANVSEVVDDCLDTLKLHRIAREISVYVPRDLRVQANAEHLQRILLNLLENACKYSEPEEPIGVRASHTGEKVSITVTNTGSVIPDEHLARLGERFYRPDTARSRSTGGAGLGLAISKRLAELHGGALRIKSSAEFGTTVEVILQPSRPNSKGN